MIVRFSSLLAVCMLISTPALAHDAMAGPLHIDHPWARQTAPGQLNGGAFLTIIDTGNRGDTLLSAASPVAAKVELHSSSMEGGIMRMRQQTQGLTIPAHGTLRLEPGSYHIMLIGLKAALERGKMVSLTLRFKKAGMITVQVMIEPVTYGAATMPNHHGM